MGENGMFRRLARLSLVGLPFAGAACVGLPTTAYPPVAHWIAQPHPAASVEFSGHASAPIIQTAARTPEELPPTTEKAPSALPSPDCPVLPITLDTVLRFAEEQNPSVALYRQKVTTALAERNSAGPRWLPDVFVGMGYYRHEGGIQLQEGPLIRSSTGAMLFGGQVNAKIDPREGAFRSLQSARNVWLNRSELSRVTGEQILEAASIYIDLLAAHTAMSISLTFDKELVTILERSKKAASSVPLFESDVLRIEGERATQDQQRRKLVGQMEAACAKLAYLLSIDPKTKFVPLDGQLGMITMVDLHCPLEVMIAQALTNGPSVREMEGLLRVIQRGIDDSQSFKRWLPAVHAQIGEGGYGAGANDQLNFAGRFDFGLQARWNVSDFLVRERRQRVAQAQLTQAQLTYQDLRSRLTMGIQEARATIYSSAEQIPFAEEQIRKAREVQDKADLKLQKALPTGTYSEVLLAARAVALAQLNYADLIREHNKAQLRLWILLGPCGAPKQGPPR
jgi:outer membrane protein TolC